jgi:hypothetical protein
MGLSARNGLSLARDDLRLRGFHHEVNVPGLLLRFLIRRFLRPFRPRLHCQFRLAPVSAASTLQTRCGIAARLRRLRLQLPLPSGSVTSLGIGASTGFAACQSAFRGCPISARSPQPFSIASLGFGSSFPVRYCPVGLLFLKPLGTSFTMLPNGFSVNAFMIKSVHFPQVLFRLLRVGYGAAAVQELCIKRVWGVLFGGYLERSTCAERNAGLGY